MAFLRGLVTGLVLSIATTAAAVSPEQSPRLARRALDAKLDGPPAAAEEKAPALGLRGDTRGLRENLIGLLPGETLEDVARTLANRQVQVQLSTERAFVLVRVPLG